MNVDKTEWTEHTEVYCCKEKQ